MSAQATVNGRPVNYDNARRAWVYADTGAAAPRWPLPIRDIHVRLPAGLHRRLSAASERTPFTAAGIVRKALRRYAKNPGVAIPQNPEPATRDDSVPLGVPAVPVYLLQAVERRGDRIVDIVAWYLDGQGELPERWPFGKPQGRGQA